MMKKLSLLNLGKSLKREEMKTINGGSYCFCNRVYVGQAADAAGCAALCKPAQQL